MLADKLKLLEHALHLTNIQISQMQSPNVAEDDSFQSQAEQGLINFTVDLLKVNYYALVAAMSACPVPADSTPPSHPGKPNPAPPVPGNPAPPAPPSVPVVGSGIANLAANLIADIVK